jgi:tRNA-dihydrouridine synthase B
MIGRATVGKPWLFKHIKHFIKSGEILPEPVLDEKVDIAIEHFKRSVEWKGEIIGVLEMRRHLSNYFKGLPHFKEIRMKLLTTISPNEVLDILEEIRQRYKGLQFEGENDFFRY